MYVFLPTANLHVSVHVYDLQVFALTLRMRASNFVSALSANVSTCLYD